MIASRGLRRTWSWVLGGLIAAAGATGCAKEYPPTAEGRFLQHCARCHEVDGSSITASEQAGETISIRSPDFQRMATDRDIANIIRRGKGKMMAVTGLSDAEVDSIVLHVRRLGARYASGLDSLRTAE